MRTSLFCGCGATSWGGRSITWGRHCYRWSDLNLTANAREGIAVDWPVRYEDLAPWYDYVEQFSGISGKKEGIPHLPDGQFLPPMEMNAAEKQVKAGIEQAYEDRMMINGRSAVLTKDHNGRAACHYCGPCSRGCSTGSYFSSLSASLPGECIHEMGTARMGRDPETSVLNRWNQTHDVPNLFVTDGACMTSSACQNPSITYMAPTARVCNYAVEEMKRENL